MLNHTREAIITCILIAHNEGKIRYSGKSYIRPSFKALVLLRNADIHALET